MDRHAEPAPPLPLPTESTRLRTDERQDYDVWLGVGLRVEAASPEEATRQAIVWLRATLENAPTHDRLQVTAPALDLVEPVVRAIQQMGSQTSRGGTGQYPQDGTGSRSPQK